MRIGLIFVTSIALMLSSCALSPEQQARQRAERQRAIQAYLERIQQTCTQYGIQRGTPQMSQCVMQIDQQNQQTNEIANRIAQQQREAEALRNAQQIYTSPAPQKK